MPRQSYGVGTATLRLDGRVDRLSYRNDSIPNQECSAAVRILLMTHVTDWRQRPRAGQEQRLLVVPLSREYIECHDTSLPTRAAVVSSDVTPPRKTRDVRPAYRESAERDRMQGVVLLEALVAPNGCVRHPHVTSPTDSRRKEEGARAAICGRGRRRRRRRITGLPFTPDPANIAYPLSPDDRQLAAGSRDGTIVLWDVDNGSQQSWCCAGIKEP